MKALLSHSDTKFLIELLLLLPNREGRTEVHLQLKERKLTEANFHDAIEEHSSTLSLSSAQWLSLFQTYTSPVFRSRFDVARLLSEKHLKMLGEI
ncbi:MAG: hypothetical protein AB7F86_11415 [Bdellovibrionales bacterium]